MGEIKYVTKQFFVMGIVLAILTSTVISYSIIMMVPSLKGLQGIQGEQGIQGLQGESGLQGQQGEQGLDGESVFEGKEWKTLVYYEGTEAWLSPHIEINADIWKIEWYVFSRQFEHALFVIVIDNLDDWCYVSVGLEELYHPTYWDERYVLGKGHYNFEVFAANLEEWSFRIKVLE